LEDAGASAAEHSSADKCLDCGAGKYAIETGKASCTECGAGKFNEDPGADAELSCTDCENGKWSEIEGLHQGSGCTACPPGSYSDALGTSLASCQICNSGKYNTNAGSATTSACQSCQAGKFLPDAGTSATLHNSVDKCLDCAVGKFTSTLASDQCSLCGPGKFLDEIGSASMNSCKNCPAGKKSFLMGSTAATDCLDCEAGKWSSTPGFSGACIDCVKGHYNILTGSNSTSSCVACPKGTIGTETGQASASLCTPCPLGRFSDALAFPGPTCDKCGMGSYNPLTGQPNCKKCPLGSLGTKLGQTSLTECKVCPVGEFSTNSSLPTCNLCKEGWTTADESSSSSSSNQTNPKFHNSTNDCKFAAEGFWLDQITKNVVECPNLDTSCSGYNTCTPGYTGYRCTDCVDQFFHATNGECMSCPPNKKSWLPHLSAILTAFIVSMVFLLNLFKIRSKITDIVQAKTPKTVKIVLTTLQKNHRKSLKSKSKILFSFFQIVSLMSRVYTISYPPEYKKFLDEMFSWVGLNIITELECYQVSERARRAASDRRE